MSLREGWARQSVTWKDVFSKKSNSRRCNEIYYCFLKVSRDLQFKEIFNFFPCIVNQSSFDSFFMKIVFIHFILEKCVTSYILRTFKFTVWAECKHKNLSSKVGLGRYKYFSTKITSQVYSSDKNFILDFLFYFKQLEIYVTNFFINSYWSLYTWQIKNFISIS